MILMLSQSPEGSGSKRVRVLVVDDSALMRRLLCDLLGSSPEIEVVGTARDGREAVLQAVRLKPDVITLDVEMPEVSGLEALPLAPGRARGAGGHGQRAHPGRGRCHAPGAGAGRRRLHAQARAEPARRDARQCRPAGRQGPDGRPEPRSADPAHHASAARTVVDLSHQHRQRALLARGSRPRPRPAAAEGPVKPPPLPSAPPRRRRMATPVW